VLVCQRWQDPFPCPVLDPTQLILFFMVFPGCTASSSFPRSEACSRYVHRSHVCWSCVGAGLHHTDRFGRDQFFMPNESAHTDLCSCLVSFDLSPLAVKQRYLILCFCIDPRFPNLVSMADSFSIAMWS
jgi:hypothetical protein